MPELVEVEIYRRLAESRALGRKVLDVDAPDAWYLKGGLDAATIKSALLGRCFTGARRIGKLLLLDTPGPTLGLRFGMTGRLVVDGVLGVDALLYSSNADTDAFDRFSITLAPKGRGRLVMRDPRRLGGIELAPDESCLGPDALGLTTATLRHALAGSTAPLKTRLMDQRHVAGVGNLAADEVLWRASLDPVRPAGDLNNDEVRRLADTLRRTLRRMLVRGGSHTGDLMAARALGGQCPLDGTPLVRRQIGGRTTWSCPSHQR